MRVVGTVDGVWHVLAVSGGEAPVETFVVAATEAPEM